MFGTGPPCFCTRASKSLAPPLDPVLAVYGPPARMRMRLEIGCSLCADLNGTYAKTLIGPTNAQTEMPTVLVTVGCNHCGPCPRRSADGLRRTWGELL
jgi:hypothetical protein